MVSSVGFNATVKGVLLLMRVTEGQRSLKTKTKGEGKVDWLAGASLSVCLIRRDKGSLEL